MIPAGTRVRLRTTNGGDCVVTLHAQTDYRPSYGAAFVYDNGRVFSVEAERIASVEVES